MIRRNWIRLKEYFEDSLLHPSDRGLTFASLGLLSIVAGVISDQPILLVGGFIAEAIAFWMIVL